jgi:hypothetical protein
LVSKDDYAPNSKGISITEPDSAAKVRKDTVSDVSSSEKPTPYKN